MRSPQYLHGWFALDFITCIPIDVIFGYLAQAGQWQINSITFKLLRMLRILKVARIVRASRIISRWQVRLRARTCRPLCSRRRCPCRCPFPLPSPPTPPPDPASLVPGA